MKLNRIIRNALKRQGVPAEKIEAALQSLKPVALRLKPAMVRRIEAMIQSEGVAVVTRKQVASWKGYQVRKNNTSHLRKGPAKSKTPADIARSLLDA